MGFIVSLVLAATILMLALILCRNKEPLLKKEGEHLVYEHHMDSLVLLYQTSEREVFVAAMFQDDPDDRRGHWFEQLTVVDQDRVIDRYAETLQARRIHIDPERRERLLKAWRVLRGKETPWATT